MKRIAVFLLTALVLAAVLETAHAERIKDIASVQGVRPNQLVGYGLVVGLDGSGDQTTQTPFTVQSIATMLGQMGVNLPPGTNLQLKNVASVNGSTHSTSPTKPTYAPNQVISLPSSWSAFLRSMHAHAPSLSRVPNGPSMVRSCCVADPT